MGVNKYSTSINLIAKHSEIFQAVEEWLVFNDFSLNEITESYLKAQRGKYLALTDRNLRRYLEVKISDGYDFATVIIQARVTRGDAMFGKIIKEEVLSLKDFLQKKFGKQSI